MLYQIVFCMQRQLLLLCLVRDRSGLNKPQDCPGDTCRAQMVTTFGRAV
jgi:hypothetical protein